jgi:hypothetical protein
MAPRFEASRTNHRATALLSRRGATLVLLVGGWRSRSRTKKNVFVHSLAGVTENAVMHPVALAFETKAFSFLGSFSFTPPSVERLLATLAVANETTAAANCSSSVVSGCVREREAPDILLPPSV